MAASINDMTAPRALERSGDSGEILPALVRRLRDLAGDEQLDHQDRVTVSIASDAIENLQCKLESQIEETRIAAGFDPTNR